MEARTQWREGLTQSLVDQTLVKLTLSKPRRKSADWRNAYARIIELKGERQLSFTFRYATRDETHNYPFDEAVDRVMNWLEGHFLNATLITTSEEWHLQTNKKGKSHLRRKANVQAAPATFQHNQPKNRAFKDARNRPYLTALGIAGTDGAILKKGQRKFRQINKYIETIGHLLEEYPLPSGARIVDMGSGKGYLTFALYDYLVNERQLPIKMTGVELRPELVDLCNDLAVQSDFQQLEFVAGDIHQYQPAGGIDMLIALHACDTATDEALAKGIRAGASVIVVAPCCQKQVRKDMQVPTALQPLLRNGILLERQAELLTDGLRALYLERAGYRTKVFEFISTEHTPKNVMITATKAAYNPHVQAQIDELKAQFGVQRHRLEELLAEAG